MEQFLPLAEYLKSIRSNTQHILNDITLENQNEICKASRLQGAIKMLDLVLSIPDTLAEYTEAIEVQKSYVESMKSENYEEEGEI